MADKDQEDRMETPVGIEVGGDALNTISDSRELRDQDNSNDSDTNRATKRSNSNQNGENDNDGQTNTIEKQPSGRQESFHLQQNTLTKR